MRSTAIYPTVIATTSRALRIIGGAGDGIPKALQPKPTRNASTNPNVAFIAPPVARLPTFARPFVRPVAADQPRRNQVSSQQEERADEARRSRRGNVEEAASRTNDQSQNQSDSGSSHGDPQKAKQSQPKLQVWRRCDRCQRGKGVRPAKRTTPSLRLGPG